MRAIYAQSLVPKPSKTVDWGRQAPLKCELSLLGSPCEAGLVNKDWCKRGSTSSYGKPVAACLLLLPNVLCLLMPVRPAIAILERCPKGLDVDLAVNSFH